MRYSCVMFLFIVGVLGVAVHLTPRPSRDISQRSVDDLETICKKLKDTNHVVYNLMPECSGIET